MNKWRVIRVCFNPAETYLFYVSEVTLPSSSVFPEKRSPLVVEGNRTCCHLTPDQLRRTLCRGTALFLRKVWKHRLCRKHSDLVCLTWAREESVEILFPSRFKGPLVFDERLRGEGRPGSAPGGQAVERETARGSPVLRTSAGDLGPFLSSGKGHLEMMPGPVSLLEATAAPGRARPAPTSPVHRRRLPAAHIQRVTSMNENVKW